MGDHEERIEAMETKVEALLNGMKEKEGWRTIAKKENERRKKCSKADVSMTEEIEVEKPSSFAEALKKGLSEEAGKKTEKKRERYVLEKVEKKKETIAKRNENEEIS